MWEEANAPSKAARCAAGRGIPGPSCSGSEGGAGTCAGPRWGRGLGEGRDRRAGLRLVEGRALASGEELVQRLSSIRPASLFFFPLRFPPSMPAELGIAAASTR